MKIVQTLFTKWMGFRIYTEGNEAGQKIYIYRTCYVHFAFVSFWVWQAIDLYGQAQEIPTTAKGQLISECSLDILNFPKNNNEKFVKFLPQNTERNCND